MYFMNLFFFFFFFIIAVLSVAAQAYTYIGHQALAYIIAFF